MRSEHLAFASNSLLRAIAGLSKAQRKGRLGLFKGRSLMLDTLRLVALALLLAPAGKTVAAEITESATSDGVVIAIRGDFESGDDRKFDQVAQKYSKAAVYLESPGGDLVTGIAIGLRAILDRRYARRPRQSQVGTTGWPSRSNNRMGLLLAAPSR